MSRRKTSGKTKRNGKAKKQTKGAKTPTVVSEATRCPGCGSTKRDRYTQSRAQPRCDIVDGKPITHIVRRWTRCSDCGQLRIDRTYENHPEGFPAEA